MIAGSCDSLPGQKGHLGSKDNACTVGFFNWGGPWRGLRPRSGAMMTHASVVGSRRNSLIAMVRASTRSRSCGLSHHPSFGFASKVKSGFECTDEIEPVLQQTRQQEAVTDGLASVFAELFAKIRILDDLDNPSGCLLHGFD